MADNQKNITRQQFDNWPADQQKAFIVSNCRAMKLEADLPNVIFLPGKWSIIFYVNEAGNISAFRSVSMEEGTTAVEIIIKAFKKAEREAIGKHFIEEFNAWSLADKAEFITGNDKNFERKKGKGIPAFFMNKKLSYGIRYEINKEGKLINAEAMNFEVAFSQLCQLILAVGAKQNVIKN